MRIKEWLVVLAVLMGCPIAHAQSGKVAIEIGDKNTQALIPGRLKLFNARGRPIKIPRRLVRDGWILVDDGVVDYRGRIGEYTYRFVSGYEYASASGGFTLDSKSEAVTHLLVPRHANMSDEGWFGGDLGSYVSEKETRAWLPAEWLAMANVVTSKTGAGEGASEGTAIASEETAGAQPGHWVGHAHFDQRRFASGRILGGLVFHHWSPPAEVPAWFPTPKLIEYARQHPLEGEKLSLHIDVARPWAVELPVWLATQQVDSVQLLGEHLNQEGRAVRGSEYQPPPVMPPGFFSNEKKAPGQIVEKIYWQMLEAGLRIPPSAGSAFGRSGSPLGYNRVYVSCQGKQEDLTAEQWWRGLKAGHSVVTNGPLLRVEINRQRPGAVFQIPPSGKLLLDISLVLTVADPVDYLDVVFNGETLYQARLDEYAKAGGKIPPQAIEESGWLVVRVVTGREQTYRIASTAPFYVENAGLSRVNAEAVEYFQQWLALTKERLASESERFQAAYAPLLQAADAFWARQLERAGQ